MSEFLTHSTPTPNTALQSIIECRHFRFIILMRAIIKRMRKICYEGKKFKMAGDGDREMVLANFQVIDDSGVFVSLPLDSNSFLNFLSEHNWN